MAGGKLQISPGVYLYLALALLLLPLRWLVAAGCAGLWHECCHWMALRAFGVRAGAFRLGPGRAEISVGEMGRGAELVCALAGPLGSLSLLLLRRYFPVLAVCGLVQGLYNLIPLYPLDGGRAARVMLDALLPPPWATRAAHWLRFVIFMVLGLLCAVCVFRLELGLLPVVIFLGMIRLTK